MHDRMWTPPRLGPTAGISPWPNPIRLWPNKVQPWIAMGSESQWMFWGFWSLGLEYLGFTNFPYWILSPCALLFTIKVSDLCEPDKSYLELELLYIECASLCRSGESNCSRWRKPRYKLYARRDFGALVVDPIWIHLASRPYWDEFLGSLNPRVSWEV